MVLVADDSATVRMLVRVELELAGYEVLEAADGRLALELARGARVDVVLLDVEMPVLDGYATVTALKTDPATADVPVVFLTGRLGSEDVVRGLRLGGHDYLRKPPDPAALLARVAAAARVKALEDELRRRADELDRVSRTDVLTGLHNRRHAEEHLRRLSAAARRHGNPFAVLVADVDHFKRVNDTAGHAAGDAVLQAVAGVLQGSVRTEDLVARWGGEEFLVALPHTGARAAGVLAERLRARVAGLCVPVDGRSLRVTISIGGAATLDRGVPELLAAADRELYAAKDGGRDGVRVRDADPAPG